MRKEERNKGVDFCGLLTLLFVYLKCTEHIDWSWWWVFSPMWLPLFLVLILWILATWLRF